MGVTLVAVAGMAFTAPARAESKEIVYLTPGLDLPFWRYLSKGIEAEAKKEEPKKEEPKKPDARKPEEPDDDVNAPPPGTITTALPR